MTAQFHEGQDVEVADARGIPGDYAGDLSSAPWVKAKIVRYCGHGDGPCHTTNNELHEVQFPDGTGAVFDAENIRAVDPMFEHAPESKPGGGFL
jgi:hypothetical protein